MSSTSLTRPPQHKDPPPFDSVFFKGTIKMSRDLEEADIDVNCWKDTIKYKIKGDYTRIWSTSNKTNYSLTGKVLDKDNHEVQTFTLLSGTRTTHGTSFDVPDFKGQSSGGNTRPWGASIKLQYDIDDEKRVIQYKFICKVQGQIYLKR